MRDTFLIRTEWKEAIFELPPEDQAKIFQNLFYFHSGQENLINLNNLGVKLVWKLIEPNLIRNAENYDRRKETSRQNGLLGGRPPAINPLEKPNNLTPKPIETKKPNETLSVTVSDSVSDSVIVSGSEKKDLTAKAVIPFYSDCIAIYNDFILGLTSAPAKINGMEGKGMKSIIRYLQTLPGKKAEIPEIWKFILAKYDKWEAFHQKQLKLSQIDSNLINIIKQIKNETTSEQSRFKT
jgi:hypothetical protein